MPIIKPKKNNMNIQYGNNLCIKFHNEDNTDAKNKYQKQNHKE